MKLNKKLNFVVPVESSVGMIYVHATPISEETFDRYFMVIGQAFTQIYSGGLGLFGGPRVAAKLIKRIAEKTDEWDGPEGVEAGLFGEMRRLSMVIVPGKTGWENVTFDEALSKGILSKEDASEVENALAFFTVASSMHKRSEIPTILRVVSKIWDAEPSSLNSTEFSRSLPMSTEIENTGAKEVLSPIPV